jgi:serine/threonine protein kinase
MLGKVVHRVDFKSRYHQCKKIAEGGTATIHAAVDRTTRQIVAVKVFKRDVIDRSELESQALVNEIEVMR